MKKLPKKLSDRILVALHDLELVEADPRYKIDMDTWHKPNGQCAVCLAGSVMAKTLNAPIKVELDTCDFPYEIEEQLEGLNAVRCGADRPLISDKDISCWEKENPARICFSYFYDCHELAWFSSKEKEKLGRMSNSPRSRETWKLHMLDIVGRLKAEGR